MKNGVPEGRGTCDAFHIAEDLLTIQDLKFGKGVVVEAADNSQIRMYALGVLETFHFACDVIETIKMRIIQPRTFEGDPITEEVMSKAELL